MKQALVMGTVAVMACVSGAAVAQAPMSFVCGAGPAAAKGGGTVLTGKTMYAKPASAGAAAFGFDMSTAPGMVGKGACVGDKPYFFSVAVPDGNYEVTLVLGAPDVASTTTVRAESRRLFVDEKHVAAGGTATEVFNVNVRTSTITPRADAPKADAAAEGAVAGPVAPVEVKLKSREIGALDWDEKLTLEFNGDHPAVRSISIRPVTNVPTVYIAGDSTVVDQDKEPWAAWGQMLPVFFGKGVAISNQAESGETIRSFVGERRFAKVMSTIKAGDTLMIQFAHNDQKTGGGYVPAMTDFKTYLKQYIDGARSHGATVVLVTPMNRRNFADGKIVQTLGEYPQAMREVAAEQKLGLIDLNALSKTLFEAMGEEGTLHAFVHYPANTFPEQTKELADNTHFNSYGAYELARAIVQNMRDQKLPLAAYLKPGIAAFDPAKPDALASWKLPMSPSVSTATPYGR